MRTSLEAIIAIVAREFDVSITLLKGKARPNYLAEARAAVTVIAMNQGYSLVSIAAAINRHHSTIMHHNKLYYETNCLDHIKPKVNIIKSKLQIA